MRTRARVHGRKRKRQSKRTHFPLTESLVRLEDGVVFMLGPRSFADVWVQVVVPVRAGLGQRKVSTLDVSTRTRPCVRARSTKSRRVRIRARSPGGTHHRSRHCLPMRPGRCEAMSDQRLAPYDFTSSKTLASSWRWQKGGGGVLSAGGTGAMRAAAVGAAVLHGVGRKRASERRVARPAEARILFAAT